MDLWIELLNPRDGSRGFRLGADLSRGAGRQQEHKQSEQGPKGHRILQKIDATIRKINLQPKQAAFAVQPTHDTFLASELWKCVRCVRLLRWLP
jgi:hypothetical protein